MVSTVNIDKVEFKCEDCGGVFETTWTEEEAREEQKNNGWGDVDNSIMAQVCDACYERIMKLIN